jgi:hypothetical protein
MTRTIVTSTVRSERPPRTAANRRLGLVGLCGVIGLAVVGPTRGSDTFDGTYTGTRVLTKGEGDRCPAKDDVSVTIHGEALKFTNSQLRNFAIGFDPRPDGTFGEIHTDMGGTSVLIRGRIVGGILDADVTGPVCEHHWHLTKSP